ncbi:hypothetical protein WR25_16412 [Diploscapter pachys]|uniref:Uncharacterized protein n=1 Tax=Diploscapter pachys TaxID=2018661 RepID=A0A2A2L8N5_9BILA|nr:hypothetical protein WR25_16412 [Diploscapter pachys]
MNSIRALFSSCTAGNIGTPAIHRLLQNDFFKLWAFRSTKCVVDSGSSLAAFCRAEADEFDSKPKRVQEFDMLIAASSGTDLLADTD